MKADRIIAMSSAALALVAGGCATQIVNPMDTEQSETDRTAVYEAGKRRSERQEEKKFSVDVFIDVDAIDAQRVSLSREQIEEHLVSALDGYIRSRLQKLPFFKVTTSDNVVARIRARKMATAVETGEEPEVAPREEAQYVILAKFDSVLTHGDGGVANSSTVAGTTAGVAGIGSMAGARTQNDLSMTGMGVGTTLAVAGVATAALGNLVNPNVVDVSMTFEFFDNVNEKTISTENVVRRLSGNSKDNTVAEILDAARACASEYIDRLGRDYSQEARVTMIRGEGRYARITLGRNDGVVEGTNVQFYEFEDLDDIMDGWTKEPLPIGYGTVIGAVDARSCWVEVQKNSRGHVKRFHYVKVIDVPKTKSSALERVGLGNLGF